MSRLSAKEKKGKVFTEYKLLFPKTYLYLLKLKVFTEHLK